MADEQARLGYTNVAMWAVALTNDTIGQLSFGIPFGSLDAPGGKTDLSEAVRTVSDKLCWLPEFPFLLNPIIRYIPILRWPRAGSDGLRVHAGATIRRYMQTDPKDLGPTLFNKLGGSGLTETDIIQEAALYIVAGTDTTATTFTYLIWVLAQRPDLLARLRAEIKGLAFDNQHIKTSTFVECLLTEALRLYGSAAGVLPRRVPREGARMGSYYVPPGTEVHTQAWTMHRNASIFPEPEAFRPERWEKPTKAMTDNFYAFGGGARSCIGMHLARMEMRLALYAFFTRFDQKLELAEEMRNEDMVPPQSLALTVGMKRHRCLLKVA